MVDGEGSFPSIRQPGCFRNGARSLPTGWGLEGLEMGDCLRLGDAQS